VLTDDELMTQVSGGAVDQLSTLFDRHHRALFRFFHHLSSSGALAEDLTQEVFFRMLKFRGTFQPGARFTPWMYQIARNVHVDHLRKRQNETSLWDDRQEAPYELPDPQVSAETRLLRSADVAILRRALEQLPADRRELLVLSRWQNLKYEEIGSILQCDAGVIKTRVFRAMRQLSDIYFRLAGRRAS
jgi:RNA polymerase sigma factor (sigma-70 family)